MTVSGSSGGLPNGLSTPSPATFPRGPKGSEKSSRFVTGDPAHESLKNRVDLASFEDRRRRSQVDSVTEIHDARARPSRQVDWQQARKCRIDAVEGTVENTNSALLVEVI